MVKVTINRKQYRVRPADNGGFIRGNAGSAQPEEHGQVGVK